MEVVTPIIAVIALVLSIVASLHTGTIRDLRVRVKALGSRTDRE